MFWNHGRTLCVPFLKSKGLTQLTRKCLNVHWLEWTPTFLSSSRRRPCNLLETLTVLISRLVEGGGVGELVEKVVVEESQRLSVLRIIMPCNLLETLTVLMSWLGEVKVVEEVVEEVVVEEKQRLSVLRIFIPCKLLETLTVLISRQVEGDGVEKGVVEADPNNFEHLSQFLY